MSTLGTIPRNAAIALLVTSWGFVAGAADLYWDPNGGTAGTGGTGNWNLSDPFWRLGSDTGTLQSWPGSASDVAFFGGSAGTVTVSSAGVQAGGLNFSTTGYTIAASGGNSLTLVGPATVTTGSGVAATMNASLGGSAGLTKAGAGSFTVAAGSAAYSGTTTVSAGTLQLDYAGGSVPAPNSTAASIASDATLNYFLASGTGYENVTTNISGSGSLRFDQAGGLVFQAGGLRLAGTNSFSGTIVIGENAALIANSAGALQGKPAVVFTGSVGRLGIADTASGSVIGSLSGAAGSIDGSSGTINTPRSLTIEQNSTSSFGGTIEDGTNGRTISLTKSGAGTLTLTGNNTYSGATTVSAGTLQLNYAGGSVPAVNSTAKAIASDATLAYFLASGTGYENVTTNISGSGTLRFDQDGGLTFNLGGLRLAGTNSFSGTIEIGENAALVANSAGALQGKPAIVFTGSVGRLGIADTASGSVIKSLSGAAGSIDGGSGTSNTSRSLTIEQNSTSSFGGSIVDGSNGRTFSLTKSGSGTLTLSGSNSYTGGTTISGGRLEIAPAGRLAAAGAITINGATADLRYNASTPLTAPLTFTQGTISGTGTIGTAVTVAAGSILAPGNSPGAQAYTSGLTWSPSGSYQWEINDAAGTVGTNWDVLNVSGGALNLTGLSSESRFNLDLITLSGTASGLMANYIDGQSYSFAIATYSSLALPTGFTDTDLTSLFQLNTSGWLNPLPAPGNFNVVNDAGTNTINLVIVPEPAGLVLAGLGSVAAAWALRRRRFPVSAA